MPTANVNGTSIFYRQAGQGPDVVLVHGLAADHAHWYLRILPQLASEFRVTVYDLRGHGLSASPPTGYSSAVMAADLAALLEHLGVKGAHVVGHSFGGVVALQLARRAPTLASRLTIADSRVRALQPVARASAWAGWPAWQQRLAAMGVAVDGDADLDFNLIEHVAKRGDVPRGQLPGGWTLGRRSRQRWQTLLATTSARRELGARAGVTRTALRRIWQPTRLVYGEHSFCLPTAYELARVLPDSRLILVSGAGHFHPITSPDTMVAQIRAFPDQGRASR